MKFRDNNSVIQETYSYNTSSNWVRRPAIDDRVPFKQFWERSTRKSLGNLNNACVKENESRVSAKLENRQ